MTSLALASFNSPIINTLGKLHGRKTLYGITCQDAVSRGGRYGVAVYDTVYGRANSIAGLLCKVRIK